MMSAKKWCFTCLLLVTLIASACAPATSTEVTVTDEAQPEVTTEETTEPSTGTGNKVARFIFTQEFDNLNPIYSNMWFTQITWQLWNCYAWDYDDQNNPVPVLVKEMPTTDNGGISADGTTITLKLRDDIKWSDGTPITSADFKFTYDMYTNGKNAVSTTYPYDEVASFETPDATTVIMTFNEPFAPWMGLLWKGILPQHTLQAVFDADGTLDAAAWNKNPDVSCGPFVFQEWESGSFARFVANDAYWLGRPKLDEIFIRFVPDDAAQIEALKNGDGDLGTFFTYEDVAGLEAAGITVLKVYSGYNEGIYFNLGENGHPALKELDVRRAIALAMDRFTLNEDLNLGLTIPAVTDWDNTPWVDPSLQPWPYDPEQAKSLLDGAGWVDSNGDGVRDKDGVELVLKYGTTTRQIRVDTQAVFQQQLADVGIQVDLLNYDSDVYFGGFAEGGPAATGELDIFQYSSTPNYPDPDVAEWKCDQIPTAENPDGTNWQAVCDETLDGLFTRQSSEVDFAARQQTFYEITKHIYENIYWLGVWQDPDLWGISSKITGAKISGATPFYNVMEWELSE